MGASGPATRIDRSWIIASTAVRSLDRASQNRDQVALEARQHHVVGHRQRGHQAVRLAILRHQDDARLDALGDALDGQIARR